MSERACDRCRERRVKCDKRVPECERCEKFGKPCPGYDKKRKFVDEGIALRKKFQQYQPDSAGVVRTDQDGPEAQARSSPIQVAKEDTLPRQSIPSTFEHRLGQTLSDSLSRPAGTDQPILNQPRHLDACVAPEAISIPNTTAPGMPIQLDLQNDALAVGADLLADDFWVEGEFDPEWFDLEPEAFYGRGNNSCGFLPNAPSIVDEVDRVHFHMNTDASATPMSNGREPHSNTASGLWAPESQFSTSTLITGEREHEMAFLTRHYTESLGPWMDLFDRDKYFTQLVPLKALGDVLLRNAIAAVAAKQLGRVQGKRQCYETQSQKPSALETLGHAHNTDWFYKAANYYDKAIAFSRQYLQVFSGGLSAFSTSDTQTSSAAANSNDLLVAVSIFSLYESLDSLEVGRLQHLVGMKSLMYALPANDRVVGHTISGSTDGRRAAFWHYVRSDYQCAYRHQRKTFLDPDDHGVWRSYGLVIQSDGTLYQSTKSVQSDYTYGLLHAEQVAHTLLWLLLRIINFLADDSGLPLDNVTRHKHWEHLAQQLDYWHDSLPPTYRPVAEIRHRPTTQSTRSGLAEVFFSIDAVAAAVQLYHFARILLLLHKPISTSSSLSSNTQSPHPTHSSSTSPDALSHAHAIIGIALGRPALAIRVEMLMPLELAGSCLEDDEERGIVLELLRAMGKDTGCETRGQCEELVRGWGWVEGDGKVM